MEMRIAATLSGPVAEFHFVLEELHQKAEATVLHNKPDRWDYYVEMVERLTEWFRGVEANDDSLAGAALALSQKAEAECPLLAGHEAVRLWALVVYARRILRTGELEQRPGRALNGFGVAPPVCALRFPRGEVPSARAASLGRSSS
jgi:hypothetical protein